MMSWIFDSTFFLPVLTRRLERWTSRRMVVVAMRLLRSAFHVHPHHSLGLSLHAMVPEL